MNHSNLRSLAAVGLKWTTIGMGFQKVYQFLAMVVLARFLVPEDFGLLSVALITLETGNQIRRLGMHSALIHRQHDVTQACNAFFFLNLLLASVLYATLVMISSSLGTFFENQRAQTVINVLGLIMLIEAGSAVQRTLAIKELEFRRLTLITVVEGLMNGAVSVVLAICGFGVWALVSGTMIGALTCLCMWWKDTTWRPSLTLSWRVTKELLGFGISLSLASSMNNAFRVISRIFVGRFLGVTTLGLYEFSGRVVYLPVRNLVGLGERVALPAFCQIQDEPERLGRWYLKLVSYSCLIMAPVTATLFLVGDQLIPLVYGEQWLPAIPIIQILAFCGFVMPLAYAWPVYVATGRGAFLARLMTARFILLAPFLVMAARVSLVAVCLVEFIALCFLAVVNLWVLRGLVKFTWGSLMRAIGSPVLASLVFSVVVILLRHVLATPFANSVVWLLIGTLLPAGAVYASVIWLMDQRLYEDVLATVASALGGKVGTGSGFKTGSQTSLTEGIQ